MLFKLLSLLDAGNATLRRLAPALGDLWSHSVTSRVMMYWHMAGGASEEGDPRPQTQQRRASLVKSPMMPPAHALFRVFEKGIRDVDEVCYYIGLFVGISMYLKLSCADKCCDCRLLTNGSERQRMDDISIS